MRHRVQFQSCSTTRDPLGGQSQTWTTYYTCWAEIDAHNGQMLYQTDEFISQSTYVIGIRYPQGVSISAQDRCLGPDGEIYVVDAPIDIERRHRKLQVFCHILNEAN